MSAPRPRRTLARPAARQGVGVHSGQPCRVRLLPAPLGAGVVFRTPQGDVPARLEFLESGVQRTVLRCGAAQVSTVEHLLAACWALGVDDLLVAVDGPELPILDGSAKPWVQALQQARIIEAGGEATPLRVRRAVEVREGARSMRLEPDGRLVLAVEIAFAEPGIGRQAGVFRMAPEPFAHAIAPARTFGPAAALPALRAQGLARGASLANTVAFAKGGVLNARGLRFPDEPLRHKVLDLLGDLALLGRPLAARLDARQPGHALTHALLRKAMALSALE